jgi:protein-disulfide isomerase
MACKVQGASASRALAEVHEQVELLASERLQGVSLEQAVLRSASFTTFAFDSLSDLDTIPKRERRCEVSYHLPSKAWGLVPGSVVSCQSPPVSLASSQPALRLHALLDVPVDQVSAELRALLWPLEATRVLGPRLAHERVRGDDFELASCLNTTQARLAASALERETAQCRIFRAPGMRVREFRAQLERTVREAGERVESPESESAQRLKTFAAWLDALGDDELEKAWRGAASSELKLSCLNQARLADPNVARAAFAEQALQVCSGAEPPAQDDRLALPAPDNVVEVTAGDPRRGANDALVTIVQFGDFQDPFCKRVLPTLERVLLDYAGSVRLVWKDHPLPFHARAKPAAQLARLAFETRGAEAFWRVHTSLFENQSNLEDDALVRIGEQAGLPAASIRATLHHDGFALDFKEANLLAGQLKVRGVPAFFVNGERVDGAQNFEKFQEVVERQLQRARAAMARGVPRAELYQRLMSQAPTPSQPAQAKPAESKAHENAPPKQIPIQIVLKLPTITGGLEANTLLGAVAQQGLPIIACYHEALERQPGASGTVTLRLLIAPDGAVLDSSAESAPSLDATMASCVASAMGTARFARPSAGTATVVLPLEFGIKKDP